MGGKMNPEVRASYLINHIHGLTADQLKYWIKCGWLKPMQGEGYDRFQTFTRQEYMKAKFMMYLINTIGFSPSSASDIADILLKREVVQRGMIWINFQGAMIGIPEIKE
jgi:hypothetical protein